jgi:hypothetical protein
VKPLLMTAAILFFASSLTPQEVEHAPTVAQCQADQRLWLSKLESDHGTDDVTVHTLLGWGEEMEQCIVVDPQNQYKYFNTKSEANADRLLRMGDFIERHGLYRQFIVEDEAGKR